MTDRATPVGSLPNACPFLALDEDRDRRSTVPDGRHRCYAEPEPQPRALTYQETFCLAPAFSTCRSFLDWAARAAAAPTRTLPGPAAPAAAPLVPIPADPEPPAAPPDPVQPWAAPPPWVAEPATRSTAALPPSPRSPLDTAPPEASGWADGFPPAAGDEQLVEEAYPVWPPSAPVPGEVQGTFGSRRAADRSGPRPAAPSPLPASPGPDDRSAEQSAAMAGWDVASAGAAAGWAGSGAVSTPTGPGAAAPPPRSSAPRPDAGPPLAPPSIPAASVAIPVERAPLAPSAHSPAPSAPAPLAPIAVDAENAPVPDAQPPGDPAAAAVPATGAAPAPQAVSRRPPASRWLPSFLTPDPSEAHATHPAAFAQPGSGDANDDDAAWDAAAAGWAGDEDLWPVTATTAGVARPGAAPAGAPATRARSAAPTPAGAGIPSAGSSPSARDPGIDPLTEDPLAVPPAARRRRRGVPVDTKAPASVAAQATPTRTSGSGEWIRPRQASLGGRSFSPPPILLGAVGLLVAAAILFLLPGFLAGGPAPTPAPPSPAAAATDAPERTRGPEPSAPPPAASRAPDDGFRVYTIKGGDTLIDIARRFRTTQAMLICANPELRRNPDRITVGQQLRIPPDDYECKTPTRTRKP